MLDHRGVASDQLVSLIREQRSIANARELDALRGYADDMLPAGYRKEVAELRRQYAGHVVEALQATAQRRFPKTHSMMPLVPFGFVRTISEKLAGVYDDAPKREILGVDPESMAHVDFAEMLRVVRIEEVMPEMERRCVLAGTCFASILPNTARQRARDPGSTSAPPKIEIFWPSDVYVVADPFAPSDLQAAHSLLARLMSPGPLVVLWQHWRRSLVTDPVTGMEYGAGEWYCDLITEHLGGRDGSRVDVRPLFAPWPLSTLPWVALHSGMPTGPVVDANRNLLPIVNNINASLMSELYTVDMCAAPILARKTNSPTPITTTIGPGALVDMRIGDDLQSITQSPDLAGMRATNQAMQETLALTLRISTDAFVAQQGAPASGVAMQIKNEPQDKMRREALTRAVPFEQEDLLPLLSQVFDHWRVTKSSTATWAPGRRYSMQPADRPEYESRAERQLRLGDASERRWISDASAATAAGYYPDVGDAEVAVAAVKLESMTAALSMPLDADAPGETDTGDTDIDTATATPADPVGAMADLTINEITLGIERMGRLGDVDTVNILRRALAQKLGVAAPPPVTAASLAPDPKPIE